MVSIKNAFLSGVAVGTILLPTMAIAQTAPEQVQPEASVESQGLGDIVVTAQKRSESIQKVPIAISALTGDQLAKQGVTNITGLASQVPSFQITTPFSDAVPIFSLRGVSAVDYSQNQSSPVALYVDEDYKGLPVFTSLQLFDVDRVEVLRGPQGTLFGKNTTGGAVSITTRSANVREGFSGYLTAGYGRFDRFETLGGVNIPIIADKLAARVAFTRTKADGFVKNLTPGGADQNSTDDWAVRVGVTAAPIETLEVKLRYTQSESTPTGYGVLASDIGAGGVGFSGYTREGLGFFDQEVDTVGYLRIRNRSASARVNWDVTDGAALTSVTAYNNGRWLTSEDGDGSPFDVLTDDYFSDAVAISQDLRLASTDNGALKWLLGAYFYRDRVDSGITNRYFFYAAGDANNNGQLDCFDDGLTGCSYSNSLRQVRKSYAVYSHNDYRFGNGFTATLGLRYTWDKNRLDRYEASLGYFDPVTNSEVTNVAPTISGPPPVRQLDNEYLSGKLGLSYETAGGALLYVSASRGYRGGAFNGQALFSPQEITIAEPERLDAFELGAKLQSSDRKVRLNSAAFFYNYRNQQFIDATPDFLQILYNAPKSHLWGAETELTAQPTPRFRFRISASYLNAKYKEITLENQNLSGNTLILAPKWTVSGGVDWTVAEGTFGNVSLHTDSRYTSRIYFDAFNTDAISQGGYDVHDARLTYQTVGEKLELAAWIRNIFEEKYEVYALDLLGTLNFNYAQRGRPREYGVQATFRF